MTHNNTTNTNGRLKKFFDSLSWQEYVLAAVVLFMIIFYAIHISHYTQLPSPVYGGDIYRAFGMVKNIVAGNPIWSDAYFAGEINFYTYLIALIEALVVKLTGADIYSVFMYFSLSVVVLSAIAWYLLAKRIFHDNKNLALLTVLSFLLINLLIGFTFHSYAYYVTLPLFLYFWLGYEQHGLRKDGILAGVMLGLTALIYGPAFIALIASTMMIILIYFIMDIIKEKNFFGLVGKYFMKYWMMLSITIAIALLFFMPLMIRYHLHQINMVSMYGDLNVDMIFSSTILGGWKSMFFNTANIFTFIIGILSLIGLFTLFLAKKSKEIAFILLIFFVNVITILHYYITRPLLDTYFFPGKLAYFMILTPILLVFGVKIMMQYIKIDLWKKIFYCAVIVLLIANFSISYNGYKNSQWEVYGRSDNSYMKTLYTFADFIEKTVPKDEAILSNDESGFMLSMISGRKVMLARRTHVSNYVDIDERIADADVAMYGKNITLSKEILQKYNVKYFYMDQYLMQYPMRTRLEFKQYLLDNNITFVEAYDRFDIGVSLENANKENLLIIPPQNITQEFMNLWEPTYPVQYGGQTIGLLYKLKE